MYFGKVFFYNFAPEMAKHLKIIVMIFALGMFIVPNQMLFAQNTETACCTTEKSEKDCCSASKKSSPCHDTSKKSQSCNSNCAKCTSCSLSVVFLGEETDKSLGEISSHAISNKVENFYLDPYLSQLSIAIWQPPKIG